MGQGQQYVHGGGGGGFGGGFWVPAAAAVSVIPVAGELNASSNAKIRSIMVAVSFFRFPIRQAWLPLAASPFNARALEKRGQKNGGK
jgi:hypothetical protein